MLVFLTKYYLFSALLTSTRGCDWFIPIGSLQNRRSLVYVEDVVTAAQLVAEHPHTPGNIYNVVGHETVTMHEILAAIYKALDKPIPFVRLAAFPVTFAVFIGEKGLALLGKRSPLTADTIQQLVTDEVYAGDRLSQLGITYTSLNQG